MSQDVIADPITGNIHNFNPPPPASPQRKRRKHSYWPDAPYNFAHEEESLWKAVITQAVIDACNRNTDLESMQDKRKAIRWLTIPNIDFIHVCLNAGLEPSHIRKLAKKALLHPTLWRDAPGTDVRYKQQKAWRKRRKQTRKKEARAKRAALIPPSAPCLILHPFI